MKDTIRREIKAILVEALGLDIDLSMIGDDAILFDGQLGMNSLACVQILTELETRFQIRFDDEHIDMLLFKSVNTLAEAVERRFARDHGHL